MAAEDSVSCSMDWKVESPESVGLGDRGERASRLLLVILSLRRGLKARLPRSMLARANSREASRLRRDCSKLDRLDSLLTRGLEDPWLIGETGDNVARTFSRTPAGVARGDSRSKDCLPNVLSLSS